MDHGLSGSNPNTLYHHVLPTLLDHGFHSLTPDDLEDSAFYAELTRRILLLTDEDDDVHTASKGGVKRFNQTMAHVGWSVAPGSYFSWSESREVSVPSWMERLWAANGGGTGVFIPRGGVHRSRKRNNKPRKNNTHRAGHKILGSS